MLTATTTGLTVHGNPGESRKLCEGLRIEVRRATNLPDDSDIEYWAHPLDGYPWPEDTVEWADGPGVGLYETDVAYVKEDD